MSGAHKSTARLPAVSDGNVGGVQVKRHLLDREAQSLAWLAHRVGGRLRRWLKSMPESTACMRPTGGMNDDGTPELAPQAGPDGQLVLEPYLPPEDFRENFRWYQSAVLGLLKEQRERAKLAGKAGGPPLSDEEYEAEVALLRDEVVSAMSTAELERLLSVRKAIDTSSHNTRPITDEERKKI